jgi:outer membrane lipoprotein-sorting protein
MLGILLLLLLVPAAARAQRTVAEVLRMVKETYAGAKQYQFKARLIERRSGVETIGSEEIAVDKGGRVWFKAEGSSAFAWSGGFEAGTLITVADGSDVWVYLKERGLYKMTAGVPEPRNKEPEDDSIDNPPSFARKVMDFLFDRYAKFASMSKRARLVREDSCLANGLKTACDVIEIKAESLSPDIMGTYTLWVEKNRHLVLRDEFSAGGQKRVSYTNSILYDVATLNLQPPADLFAFTPPQSARRVVSFFQ